MKLLARRRARALDLEDAGCTDADLLGHLRGRGCMCGDAGHSIWFLRRVESGRVRDAAAKAVVAGGVLSPAASQAVSSLLRNFSSPGHGDFAWLRYSAIGRAWAD
jgi:hypothetical protein